MRIVLLMLFTVTGTAVEFVMGIYAVHSGSPIVIKSHQETTTECFFRAAAWLVITGGLFCGDDGLGEAI